MEVHAELSVPRLSSFRTLINDCVHMFNHNPVA